jgi:hypothetical protein
MSQGNVNDLATLDRLKKEIQKLDTEEAKILKFHIWFPMPTAVRRKMVYSLPRIRFQDTKQQLQTTVTSKKTDARVEFLGRDIAVIVKLLDPLTTITTIDKKKYFKSLGKINTYIQNPNIDKWDIRRASREVKLLRAKIENDSSINEDNKKILFFKLMEIRTVLGDECEDRSYQLELKDKRYVER